MDSVHHDEKISIKIDINQKNFLLITSKAGYMKKYFNYYDISHK